MTSTYGLTAQGFIPKQQQDIITELQAALRAQFGTAINLGDQSFFGQFINIISEREALLWQLAEAIYMSQWPSGAEGVTVDNILALSGLKRQPAEATVTNPNPATQSNGITLNGLVLYGTPGKVVAADSLIASNTTPSYNFTLDNAVTIQGANNAVQSIVQSGTPAAGAFTLGVVDSAGNQLITPPMSYLVRAASAFLFWPNGAPATATSYRVMVDGTLTGTASSADVGTLVTAINAATSLGCTSAVSGTGYNLTFAAPYQPILDPNPYQLTMTTGTGTGSFVLTVGGLQTAAIGAQCTAAQLRAAIAQVGYPMVQVATLTGGFAISFGAYNNPGISIASDGTNASIAVGALNASAPNIVNSVQACISSVVDPALPVGAQRPFTDVVVAQSGQVFTATFGGTTPLTGQPASAAQTIPAMSVVLNNLGASGAFVTVTVSISAAGNPAQGIGTATCTQTGPIEVVAGQLTIIGTPSSGWTGVTNQLDCITGENLEDDTDALARRDARIGINAISPLRSLRDKVSVLSGVTSAEAFQNTSQAALQTLSFSGTPATGTSFQLVLAGGTTAPIAATGISASTIQAAINSVTGYASATVNGSLAFGYSIDFSGTAGSQAQPLVAVTNNTTTVTVTPSFGRSPNSFELVVAGGLPSAIAQTIYENSPAGIASYASPTAVTTGTVVQGSSQVVVASASNIQPGLSIFGRGITNGATVVSVNGTTVTMSQAAIGDFAAATLTFNASVQILDEDGNPIVIGFSRPQTLLVYVNIALVTDQYRQPGVVNSGVNALAKWSAAQIPGIQEAIVSVGNAITVGGIIVGAGSNGLVGVFNNVPGIVSYTLTFGLSPNPSNVAPIQLLPTQQPLFNLGNVTVSYT